MEIWGILLKSKKLWDSAATEDRAPNKYFCHHLRAIPAMAHPHFFSANLTVDPKNGYICIIFTFFYHPLMIFESLGI